MRELLRSVVLVGPPGAGKSTLGRLVARRAGVPFVDLDERLRARTGEPAGALLRREGEASFRVRELEALRQVLEEDRPALVAAGSGVVTTSPARELLAQRTRVVLLDVTPAEALRRLSIDDTDRPLASAPDDATRRARYQALVDGRRVHWDALATNRVDTSGLDVEAAGRALHDVLARADRPIRPLPSLPESAHVVGEGRAHPLSALERAALVLDEGVPDSAALQALLDAMGDRPVLRVPGGEEGKTLARAGRIAAALVDAALPPDGVVVAAGGGALLDLVGFVAATLYRGVRWAAVPTTLLAMADASLGGKTAVNLPAGKNLLGAFHAPALLVIDARFLTTLPARERRAGVVEMLKHALLAADAPLDGSEAPADEGLARVAAETASAAELARLVERSLAVKGAVTRTDPRERGLRVVLNLGHTLGHALEQAARAQGLPLLHGEAVAEGLRFALWLSERRCGLDEDVARRMRARVDALGVPRASALGVRLDADAVLPPLHVDKKRRGGRLRFVGLAAPGAPVLVDDVPDALVREWLALARDDGGC